MYVECAINYYSEPGATECIACPSGKTTNDLKGSAVCSDPDDGDIRGIRVGSQVQRRVINLFKSGMAYMITIILSIAFAVFGHFISAGRMKNPRLCVLAPPMVLARMAMVALSLTSETFFLAICFAEGLINPFFSRWASPYQDSAPSICCRQPLSFSLSLEGSTLAPQSTRNALTRDSS